MSNTWYEGFVPMRADTKKREFYSGDDDFAYKIPRIFFECGGEIDDSNNAFNWSSNSVIVEEGNRTVKYVDYTSHELLVTDLNGHKDWVDGVLADFMGWNVDDVTETREVQTRWVEEYDWEKSEKRKYRLVLEETSTIEKYDVIHIKEDILKVDSGDNGRDVLAVSHIL